MDAKTSLIFIWDREGIGDACDAESGQANQATVAEAAGTPFRVGVVAAMSQRKVDTEFAGGGVMISGLERWISGV